MRLRPVHSTAFMSPAPINNCFQIASLGVHRLGFHKGDLCFVKLAVVGGKSPG